MIKKINSDYPVICWWSGGVTSAVACKIAIDLFGIDNCRIMLLDTYNEDDDTYRFAKDCSSWYGKEIEAFSAIPEKYSSIQDIWISYKGLNFATGAICSTELKRAVRQDIQKNNNYSYQVFGFDSSEIKRSEAMKINYPDSKPMFPLLMFAYSKKDCIKILQDNGIDIPVTYKLGFKNNNCFKTGCVQGGIGYWQKMRDDFPEKFNAMAEMEHYLTDLRGEPVTMCKDQSKEAKNKPVKERLVFLKPHKDYPDMKDISMIKGRPPEPLVECNGFCGTNDLQRNDTEKEINNQLTIDS